MLRIRDVFPDQHFSNFSNVHCLSSLIRIMFFFTHPGSGFVQLIKLIKIFDPDPWSMMEKLKQSHPWFCHSFLFIFQTRVSDPYPDPHGCAWIRINLSCWIRIRIQNADPDPDQDPDPGGQKCPTKITKRNRIFMFCQVLHVLIWGLKASPVAWPSFMEA